jgi:hypothetical protein
MSTHQIQSKLTGNVITSTSSGLSPQKSTGADSQLWEFVADPAGSGYFFIKSQSSDNVIDIHGASISPGALLDLYPQTTGAENQLWEFVADPAGSGYCFIVSKLNGNVIDIQGASTSATALLDAYPWKYAGTGNQLWSVVGGSFPSVVKTVPLPSGGYAGSANYILANGSSCATLTGVKATITITEDLVWKSTSVQPSKPGFSFQLNAETSSDMLLDWLQFQLHIGEDTGLWPWINIWQQGLAGAFPFTAPSIAQVGNSATIAAVGADGSLWFAWQGIGAAGWNPELVFGSHTTSSASIAQVGGNAAIAAVGADGGLWFAWQAFGSVGWNQEQVVVAAGASSRVTAASVAQVGNSATIAALHEDGSLSFYWQGIGAAGWNPEPVFGPNSASSVSITQVGGSAAIAAAGADGGLWFAWQAIGSAGWNPPEQVVVAGTSSPITAASVAQVAQSAEIVAVHEDGTLSFYWQAIGASGWNPEPVPGLNNISSASIAQVGNSTVIAAIGSDGSLWFAWQAVDSAGWNLEPVSPPDTVRVVTPARNLAPVGNTAVITTVGAHGGLFFFYQPIGAGGWTPEAVVIPGQPSSKLQFLWEQLVANPVANVPQPARIPAGYSIIIALQNDSAGRVTGGSWNVLDASGNSIGAVSYPLSTAAGGGVPPQDLSPIASFQLTIGGAMDGAYANFSQGAGVIVLEADQLMTVNTAYPSCIGFIDGTAESSNIGYGPLPANRSTLFSQAFSVVAGSA